MPTARGLVSVTCVPVHYPGTWRLPIPLRCITHGFRTFQWNSARWCQPTCVGFNAPLKQPHLSTLLLCSAPLRSALLFFCLCLCACSSMSVCLQFYPLFYPFAPWHPPLYAISSSSTPLSTTPVTTLHPTLSTHLRQLYSLYVHTLCASMYYRTIQYINAHAVGVYTHVYLYSQ